MLGIKKLKDKVSKYVLQMRFYENEFPEVGETVIATIVRFDELGAYVQLLEYDNIEGFIPKETPHVCAPSKQVLRVVDIDPENKSIVLSTQVSVKETALCFVRHKKANVIERLFIQTAEGLCASEDPDTKPEKMRKLLDVMYRKVVWPLNKYCGHSFDALFWYARDNVENIFMGEGIFDEENISDEIKIAILQNIPPIFQVPTTLPEPTNITF